MFFITLTPCLGEVLLVGCFGSGFLVTGTVGATASIDDSFTRTTEIVFSFLVEFSIERVYGEDWNYFHHFKILKFWNFGCIELRM